jgi:RNA recognition motif-containing protein
LRRKKLFNNDARIIAMPSREGSRVFLGNLPHDVREKDIERFFEKYGRVRNIFIKNGRYGFCVSWNS